jgi:hypothetical protein
MIRVSPPPAACWAVILGVLALSACGPREEKLHHVSGKVTYDGKPIPKGGIHFEPTVDGPQGYASIIDGQFDTSQQGSGVRGGSYHVRVNGFDGKVIPDHPFGKDLFPEYRDKTELPAANSTYDLNVPKSR